MNQPISMNQRFFHALCVPLMIAGFFFFGGSVNVYSQSCNGVGGPVSGGVIQLRNGQICANAANNTISAHAGQMLINASSVDAGTPPDPSKVQFRINWDDGSGFETLSLGTGIGYIQHTGGNAYSATVNHYFPATGPNVQCEYYPSVTLVVDGLSCNPLGIPPTFIRWNTDNENTGELIISETITNEENYKVCSGARSVVTFTDRSILNCPILTNNSNESGRKRRFIYGTQNTITGTVLISGISEVFPFNGVIDSTTTPSTALPAPINSLDITIPTTAQTGEVFEITMEYWNFCNPYPGPPVITTAQITIVSQPPAPVGNTRIVCNGINPSAFTISGARVGSTVNWYRNVSTAIPKVVGTVGTLIATTFANGNGIGRLPINTAFPGFNNTIADNYIVWGSYATAVGASSGDCETRKVASIRSVREALTTAAFVTPTGPTNICNNTDNVAYVEPTTPPAFPVGGPTEYIWSTSGWTGVSIDPPNPAQNVTIDFNRLGAFTIDGGSVGVALRYPSAPNCQTNDRLLDANIYSITQGGNVTIDQTICDGNSTSVMNLSGETGVIVRWERTFNGGAPFIISGTGGLNSYSEIPPSGPGTYTYYAVVQNTFTLPGGPGGPCTLQNSTPATITVNPIPPMPTITSSSATTFCVGGSVTLTASNVGGIGIFYLWHRNGVFTGDTGSDIILNAEAQSGDYTIQLIGPSPTLCNGPFSGTTTVTINPLPTASNPTGGGAICAGSPAPDIVWTLTGSAPYQVTYTDGTSTFGPITELTNTFMVNGPTIAGTYQITSLRDANTCMATNLGGTASVIIGGTPPSFDTQPSLNPPSACDAGGGTTDPQLLFSLDDAGSASQVGFILTYQVDGHASRIKNFNTNATGDPTMAITFSDFELNSLISSPHVVRIVALQSSAGCQTLVGRDLNFTVNPLPILVIPQTKTICSGDNVNCQILLTPANAPAGTTFSWPDPDGAAGPATAGVAVAADPAGTLHIRDILTNTTGAAFNLTYVVTPTSSLSCPGVPGNVVITVDPEPVLVPGQTKTVCGGTPINHEILLNPLNAPAGTVFNWPDPDGAGPATAGVNVPMGAAGTLHITDVIPNTTGAPTTMTYVVTPTGGATCVGTSQNVFITINPTPLIPVGQTKTICTGQNVDVEILLSPLNLPAGTVFNWPDPDSGGPATAGVNIPMGAAGTLHITDILTNFAATPITVTYNIVATTNGAACSSVPTNINITVEPLPVVVDHNDVLCEDSPPGSLKATAINLHTYDATITGGVASRTVEWYEDNGSGGLGALITPGVADGNDRNYSINATKTIHARVINTTSSVAVPCSNVADMTLNYQALPNNNPIRDSFNNIVGSPLTVCSGSGLVLFQIDPTINQGASYNWTIPTAPGEFEVLSSLNNFSVIIRFSNAVPSPGLPISIVETLGAACRGNSSTINVIVESSPPQPVIAGTGSVCTNQTGVAFNVTNPVAGTYNWTVPTGASIISGQGSNAIVVNHGAFNGNVNVTHTSAASCTSSPAVPFPVSVITRPAMTSSTTATICSGVLVSSVLTFAASGGSGPIGFGWQVINVVGSIGGTSIGNSGSGNIGQTLTNTSGSIGSIIYRVTPTGPAPGNCAGNTQDVTVTVNPEPALVNTQSKTICSGGNVNYEILLIPANLPTGTLFNWAAPTMSDASVQGAAGVNVASGTAGTIHIADVLTNTTGTSITATYAITPTSGIGCSGTSTTVVITVDPEPALSPALNATSCSDDAISLNLTTDTGSVAAGNYNITNRIINGGLTAAGGNAFIPANGVTASYLANDAFTNLTTNSLTVTYTVVPVGTSSCPGSAVDVIMTIDPEPIISNTLNIAICSDETIALTLNTAATSMGASSYNIIGRTVATGLIAGSNAVVPATGVTTNYLFNDTYTNTGLVPLDVIYTVVAESNAGCEGDQRMITITINPEPVVSPSLNKSVCSGAAINLTPGTNGTSVAADANGYNILSIVADPNLVADGGNVAAANNVRANYLANDVFTNTTGAALDVTYSVQPRSAATCLGNPVAITITINPEPVVSGVLDKAVCSDMATGLVLNTDGQSVGAANYNITARSVATGLTASGTNVGVPNTSVNANYLAGDVFTNTGILPLDVTYTVVPVSSAGCIGAPRDVIVTINPELVVSSMLNATRCSGFVIGLNLNTNNNAVTAANYDINSVSIPVGLIASTGNVTVPAAAVNANYLANDIYTNTGIAPLIVTYTVVPNSASGCTGDPRTISITIDPQPVVSTTLDVTVCSDAAVGLLLNTNSTSVAAASYIINAVTLGTGVLANGGNAAIPSGNVSANYLATDSYTNPTAVPSSVTYNVQAESSVGCSSAPRDIVITINPEPVVANTLNASICSDVSIALVLATAGTSVPAAGYNVTTRSIATGLVAAGTNAAIPSAPGGVVANYLSGDIYTNTGTAPLDVTYTVVPVSGVGCLGDPMVITMTITPESVVANGLDLTICSDIASGLILSTSGNSVVAASYNITSRTSASGLVPDGSNAVVAATGVNANYLAADRFTNMTNNQLDVIYTVVPVSGAACLGDPFLITVTIDPEPVVSSALNATMCSDIATGLILNTNGLSVAASDYDVTDIDVNPGLISAITNASTGSGVAANYLEGDRFTNIGANPVVVNYTIVPNSTDGCKGDPFIVAMTITPEPVLSGTLNLIQCSGLPTGLILNTNGTSVAAQNYNITNINIATGLTAAGTNRAVGNGLNANHFSNDRFTNLTTNPLTVVYTVVPVSAAGCPGDPVDVTTTINPEPVVSQGLNLTTCSDLPIGLLLNTNSTSVPADNYNITAINVPGTLTPGSGNVAIGNGVAANYLSNDVFTNTTKGSLNVTYTVVPNSAAGCVGDPVDITVTIDPEPVVANGLDVTICGDANTGLSLNTNNTSVTAASYNITVITIATGLTASGTNVSARNNVAASYPANDQFKNVGKVPLDVVYTVVPVSASACLGNPRDITVTVNPEPVVADSLGGTVCSDAAIGLTLNTESTSVAANAYNVTAVTIPTGVMAGSTNAAIPATGQLVNYLALDSYTNLTRTPVNVSYSVVPRSTALCLGDPEIITITINPEPVISDGLDVVVCSDIATGLMLTSVGTSVVAANYNITGINVPTGLTPAGTNVSTASGVAANYLAADMFTNNGSASLNVRYTVVPVSGSGCLGNPRVITITINPEPVASGILDNTVCSDLAIGLTLNTNLVSVGAANYNITNRTIAAGLNPAVTNAIVPANSVAIGYLTADIFTNTGTAPLDVIYTIVPVSSAGCLGDPLDVTITINSEPVLSNGLNVSVCSDVAGGLMLNTNANSVAAANYNILGVTIPAALTSRIVARVPMNTVAANYLAGDIYTNTTKSSLDVEYTVVPVSAAGCLGDLMIISQTVDPEPILAGLDKTICSDAITGISLTSDGASVSATTFDVTSINLAAGLVPAAGNVGIANGVNAAYIFNDQFTNTGNSPLAVKYTVVPNRGANCQGNPVIVTVTIDSEPVVSSGLNNTVCSNLPSGITLNTDGISVAAASYNITNIAVPGGLISTAGNATPANGVASNYIVNDVFTNTGSMSLNVTYTVVPVSAMGCLGNPIDIILTIDPKPVVDPFLGSATICSTSAAARSPVGITLNTNGVSVAAANYNITLKSRDAALVGVPTTGMGLTTNAIVNDTYDNTTSVPLQVVYTIVPVSAAGCFGNSFDIKVIVNPEPVVNSALDNTVCSDDISGLILSTNGLSVAANSYRLVNVVVPGTVTANSANTSIASVSGINLIKNDRYTNTTTAAVIVTYEIRGISSLTCEGESEFIDLTINPKPVLNPTLSPAPVCSDVISSVTLATAPGSVAASSYNINNILRQPGLVAGGSNASIGLAQPPNAIFNDIFTNTTAGPLTVTYKIVPVNVAGCLGAEVDIVFTVNPAPALAPNLDRTVCTDEMSGIIFATSGASVSAANYNITNVSIQAGLVQSVGNTGARAGVASSEIQNDQFQNPTNAPLTVTYRVQGVTAATCTGPQIDIILTVEPTITAVPVNNVSNICSATVTDIDLTSPTTPTSGNITFNYTVVSSVGGQITGFVPALNNLPLNYKITDNLVNNSDNAATVTYNIVPVANGAKHGVGCFGAAVPIVVTVEPKPKLMTGQLFQTRCESDGVNVSPTNISLTSTTMSPSVGTLEFNVISAIPTGGMTLQPATSPLKTTYTNGELILDQWNNPTFTDQTVIYKIQPVVSGGLGCQGDSIEVTITVKPRPTIAPVTPVVVCGGEYKSIPLTTDIPGTFATWSVVAPATITGASAGGGGSLDITLFNSGFNTETVAYTVTPNFNNCDGIPTMVMVTVNPIPDIVNLPSTITVCDGEALNVPLKSNIAGTTFDWVVTDGFNLEAPGFFDGSGTMINQVINNSKGFQALLNYKITPRTASGCVGLQQIMNVNVGSIVPNITSDRTKMCSGARIQMTNSSLGATSHRWFYRVQGTTTEIDVETTPTVNYQLDNTTATNPIVYEIVYQPSNKLCSVPDVVTPITVFRDVKAGFDEGTVPPIVGGTSTVNFTNTSNPVDGTQFRYEWDFGSGQFASPATFIGDTPPSVSYSQQGIYQVTLKATNIAAEAAALSCESSVFKTITVPVLPLVVGFTIDPPAGCSPITIKVIENISTGDIMEWKVVDSNGKIVAISRENLPEFFIPVSGFFNVQLTTKDSFTNAAEFATSNFEIYDLPIASFLLRPPTVFIPDTELTTFNFTTGANTYSWDFGDGETSDEREPKHVYKIEGIYDVMLVAGFTHDNGIVCTDTLVQEVVARQGGQMKIPNAFTPNPAGPSGGTSGVSSLNDVFLPIVKGVEEFNMQIYDRWGNLIFESNSSSIGWDGYNRNGSLMPSGVYVYKLTLRLSNGQRSTQVGDITMIR